MLENLKLKWARSMRDFDEANRATADVIGSQTYYVAQATTGLHGMMAFIVWIMFMITQSAVFQWLNPTRDTPTTLLVDVQVAVVVVASLLLFVWIWFDYRRYGSTWKEVHKKVRGGKHPW